jgi:oxygen-independent coproporphyrinogen-3 oxidase
VEDVMLRVRLRDGLPVSDVDPDGVRSALAGGLIEPDAHAAGRLVLTLPGRLLADAVIRDLV